MKYSEYITSSEWRGKHKEFLRRSGYRCSMFTWVKCGKGGRYNCHHTNYNHIGEEKLWRDVIVLCPFAHTFIIHGILSGFRRPSQQAIYPNRWQRLAHAYCRIPPLIRLGVLAFFLSFSLAFLASSH